MTFAARQARLRVYEGIERVARRFRSDEDLWPVRVPVEPLSLESVVRQTAPDEGGQLDVASLRARSLLHLRWDDGSAWEAWVMVLPSGLKLFCDTGEDETRILASGGRHANEQAERLFLRALAESRGERFGIEMAGGPPVRVRTSITDREFVLDFFVDLFEDTEAEAGVRRQLAASGAAIAPEDEVLGRDFRTAVARWLDLVG